MRYKIIGGRGVSEEGAPFLLDEGKDLELEFENLNIGYAMRLSDKSGRTVTRQIQGKQCCIPDYKLSAGLWYLELIRMDAQNSDKILCTPIRIQSISSVTQGLICYPEIDEILKNVADLAVAVEELKQWREEVAPKIHEHKIIK